MTGTQRTKMKQTPALRAAIFLALTLAIQGCSSYPADRLPRPQGAAPVVIDPGGDQYTDVTESMAPIEQIASPSPSVDKNEKKQQTLEDDLCNRVGKAAIEYSTIAAEETGEPFIARILKSKLVADNRQTATRPEPGQVEVVIECFVTVALSTGDRGTVSIFELMDSDKKLRVRWQNYKPQ